MPLEAALISGAPLASVLCPGQVCALSKGTYHIVNPLDQNDPPEHRLWGVISRIASTVVIASHIQVRRRAAIVVGAWLIVGHVMGITSASSTQHRRRRDPDGNWEVGSWIAVRHA